MKLGLIKIVIYNDMLIDRGVTTWAGDTLGDFYNNWLKSPGVPGAAIEIYADRRDRGRKLLISGILDTGNFSWWCYPPRSLRKIAKYVTGFRL